MNELSRFDPFNNRLCRDVRNALSKGFNNTLDKREMEPVRRIADFFLDDPQPEHISTYIEQGNLTGARRIADKALSELMVQKDQLSLYADPQLLLPKLKVLDPVPPKLSETGV